MMIKAIILYFLNKRLFHSFSQSVIMSLSHLENETLKNLKGDKYDYEACNDDDFGGDPFISQSLEL